MRIITDETRIAKGARLGKIATFVGLGFLVGGLIISLALQETPLLWLSFACLLIGNRKQQTGAIALQRNGNCRAGASPVWLIGNRIIPNGGDRPMMEREILRRAIRLPHERNSYLSSAMLFDPNRKQRNIGRSDSLNPGRLSNRSGTDLIQLLLGLFF